jgi:membrane protease YdiL (CAAX protease family)
MINTPIQEPEKGYIQMHPALQLLTFTGIFLIVLAIGNIIGAAIATALYGIDTVMGIVQLNLASPNVIHALWIIQIAGTTLPILAAPVFFDFVIVKEPAEYIKPGINFNWALLLLVFAIMFISSPLIEILSNINQKMVLPPFLKWMRDSEDNAQKLTNIMLQMKTVWSMLFNLFLVGFLTAVAEEVMFRGCLQTIFTRWTKNTHAAIWITAILFSAFHMEFFGFLPRMLLGALFGYFVAWSGSIWPAIWAHFINNGTAVVVTYLYQHKKIGFNPDDQHVFNNAGYIFSLLIVLFLLHVYRDVALNKSQLQEY